MTVKEESEYSSVDSQTHKATTPYYSSKEEEDEVKNEPGTLSTMQQEVPAAPAQQAEAPAVRGDERRSNWSPNYSDYTAESYDTNWTDRTPPQQRQWTWQDYYNA